METQSTPSARTQSRGQILKAAGRLFARQGFHGTTLRQIAAKSGANGALVSYYFGGKGGLREAVMAEKINHLHRILAPLAAGDGGLTDLSRAIRIIFEHIRSDENFHRLAQRAMVEDEDRTLKTRLWEPLFQALAGLIRKASGNRLSDEEAQVRCLALCGMIQQYGNLLCFFKEGFPAGLPPQKTLIAYENYVAESVAATLCRV